MKVEIEEISPVKKALRIQVPQEVVTREFDTAFSALKNRAKIPGFRPGKAPLPLIVKRFGHGVKEDVLRKLIPNYYEKAVTKTGIRPVMLPAIDRIEVNKDGPLFFTATVEVRPTVSLGDYADIPIVRKKVVVSDSDIDRALEALREEQGNLVGCEEDVEIKEGNYAIIDFEGTVNGVPIELNTGAGKGNRGKASDYLVEVGSKSLLPGLEESLIGKKKGDNYTITVLVSGDHPNDTIRNKEIAFTIEIKEIKNKTLPQIDDEFAKDVGMDSLAMLREGVSEELLIRLRSEAETAEKDALTKKLVDMHTFDVPSSLVQWEMDKILKTLQHSIPKGDIPAVRQEYEHVAKDRVKATLILSAIAEAEEIVVEENDLDEEISRISKHLKRSHEETKRFILGQEKTLEGLSSRIREEKTIQTILSKANIQYED